MRRTPTSANPKRLASVRRMIGILTVSALAFGPAAPSVAAAPPSSHPQSSPTTLNETPRSLQGRNVLPHQYLPLSQQLPVVFRFGSANPRGLAVFNQEVATPGNPIYHHFLTHAEMETRFGPSPAMLHSAARYLAQQGIPTHVGASGGLHGIMSVRQVQAIFGTRMEAAVLHGRHVISPNGPLNIPAALHGMVYVEGLETAHARLPQLVSAPGVQHVGSPATPATLAERWFRRLAIGRRLRLRPTPALTAKPGVAADATGATANYVLEWTSLPPMLQLVGQTATFTAQLYDGTATVTEAGVCP